MNYVDANILIYAFADITRKGEKSRELIQNQRLATSVLSLDEVAYEIRKKSLEQALKTVETICTIPNLLLIAFLPEDADSFQEFLSMGLAPRDAIHALTAKKVRASIIYSEDADFDTLPVRRKTPW